MKPFAFSFSYTFFCLSSSMYSWVCPRSVLYDVLELKTLAVHALKPRTARTSGDCDQTWRERGKSGYVQFGIFKRH